MDIDWAPAQTFNSKSLLEICSKRVAKNFFCENLIRLKGEIPLTVLQYICENYCDFFDHFTTQLKDFIIKFPPEILSTLCPPIWYMLAFSGIQYIEIIVKEGQTARTCIHRFCTYCFNEYVKFKLPAHALKLVHIYDKEPILLTGESFLELGFQFICQKCHLILLETYDDDDDNDINNKPLSTTWSEPNINLLEWY